MNSLVYSRMRDVIGEVFLLLLLLLLPLHSFFMYFSMNQITNQRFHKSLKCLCSELHACM